MTKPEKGWTASSGSSARALQAPTAGIYGEVPHIGEAGMFLYTDLTEYAGEWIRITCTKEEVFYVFGPDGTTPMIHFAAGDYQYDMTALVPDIIGEGFSVRELVPDKQNGNTWLVLKGATTTRAEVRIRRA